MRRHHHMFIEEERTNHHFLFQALTSIGKATLAMAVISAFVMPPALPASLLLFGGVCLFTSLFVNNHVSRPHQHEPRVHVQREREPLLSSSRPGGFSHTHDPYGLFRRSSRKIQPYQPPLSHTHEHHHIHGSAAAHTRRGHRQESNHPDHRPGPSHHHGHA